MHATWPNEIETFLALGSIARRQDRWEESRTYYEQAVALDPLRADLRSSLVGVLVATRDLGAASDAVDDALARWPEDVGFIAEKARILQRLGRLDEAGALLKPLRTRPEALRLQADRFSSRSSAAIRRCDRRVGGPARAQARRSRRRRI